ncbi:MazG-like family protein [Streptomyces sp. TR06-5]|uniref:MazG-like family protein n=1 Tax=unclassified Streptomyces TaxID=2593676 RepID=UPI0039A3750E
MDDDSWTTAARLADWLDEASGRPREVQLLLQVLKITEEAGEAAEALQGVLGANPRKGRSHTEEDVAGELCDVIVSAMVALTTVAPDAAAVFRRHLARVSVRSLEQREASAAHEV